MATASDMYHNQGLVGYKVLRTEFTKGEVFYHVKRHFHKHHCRNCDASWHHLVRNGGFTRLFHGLSTGLKRQWIVLHGYELYCKHCQETHREPIPFANGQSRYTKSFARYVLALCKIMTISDIAAHLGIAWDTVKDLHKRYLEKRFKKRSLSNVRYVAIDEFAIQKGHKYMTIALDLETGEILYAHEGKNAESILPFFTALKHAQAHLKSISIDMSPAFISAINSAFNGKVDIIHDPYHIVALANTALDNTRKDLYRKLYGEERNVIKGMRFIILKGLEKLKEKSIERIMNMMELNEPLFKAYLLKEDLRTFWNLPNREHDITVIR